MHTIQGYLLLDIYYLGIALGEQSLRIEFVSEFFPVLWPTSTQECDDFARITLLDVRAFLAVRLDGIGQQT